MKEAADLNVASEGAIQEQFTVGLDKVVCRDAEAGVAGKAARQLKRIPQVAASLACTMPLLAVVSKL